MKIVFWGTPSYAINTLEALIQSHHEVLCVISQPDKRRGRGKLVTSSPVKQYALDKGLDVMNPIKVKHDTGLEHYLEELSADIFVVVAFGQILPKNILDIPKYGCWNAHASLLPKYRGAAPIQWSLLNGDKNTGVSIMAMEEGMDTGPVLIYESVMINEADNKESLTKTLSTLSAKLIIKATEIINSATKDNVRDIASNLKLTAQNNMNAEMTYAPMITKEQLRINWDRSSDSIYAQVKGLYPDAYTYVKDKRVKIYEVEVLSSEGDEHKTNPGTITRIHNGIGVELSTKDGLIILKKAKIEGKGISEGTQLIQQLNINTGYKIKHEN